VEARAVKKPEAYPGTQSIQRALRLLKQFSSQTPEWSLAELSDSLGMNKTTVYRMLTALEAEGLVQRTTARDRYTLGPELIVLGNVARRSNDLRTISQPELRALADESGETAVLEIASHGEVLIMEEAMGPGMVRMQAEVGTRWPLHATSTGKAILAAAETAWGPQAFARLGLPRRLPKLTPRTLTTRDALRGELEQIRNQGFATAVEELQMGYAAVSAAVVDREGEPVAAVGIGGPTSRLTEERLPGFGRMVKARAARISRKLGADV
jgi:IclR family transcriptional regulator, acetate operon repressor